MKMILFEHQTNASKWCLNHESRLALLAFEMGFGKTYIACNVVKLYPVKTLIIVPNALLSQWKSHLDLFNLDSSTFHGSNKHNTSLDSNIVLSTPATMSNIPSLHFFQRIIIDEAHLLRNQHSKVFKRLLISTANIPRKLFLTGTPICNSHNDLITLLLLSNYHPYNQHSFWAYMRTNKKISTLLSISDNFILRNNKSSTFSLPPLYTFNISISLPSPSEQFSSYSYASSDFLILRKILRMRQTLNNHHQFTTNPLDTPVKILAIQNIIYHIPPTDKIIIFSFFTSFLYTLHSLFHDDSIIYHGKLNHKQREHVLHTFKTLNVRILLINLRTGGCGLNLTEANHIILSEPYWNAAEEQQAIARIHRIGQSKPTHVYKLEVEGSIEKWLRVVQEYKTTTTKMLLDKADITFDKLLNYKDDKNTLFKKIINYK